MELSCNCVRSSTPPSCFPDGISPSVQGWGKQFICVVYNTKVSEFAIVQSVVNRVKLRADTGARQFHPLKQKRFARKTDNPSWLKQKQDRQKDPLYSIYYGPRGKLSANYFETDNAITWGRQFAYQFYRGENPQNHRSPGIVTFSLSSHRNSYVCLLFRSRFISS